MNLAKPRLDPTPIFDMIRMGYQSEMLCAAVAHFDIFASIGEQSIAFEQLCQTLKLQVRPARVLLTMLCAMKLLKRDAQDHYQLTPMSLDHLNPAAEFNVSDYLRLGAEHLGVLQLVQGLRSNSVPGSEDVSKGAAYIFKKGMASAMDLEQRARFFTTALAGRAKIVAPYLADVLDLSQTKTLLDLGGGTGIYSIACLKVNSELTATVMDSSEVLKLAAEYGQHYQVCERMQLLSGNMFDDSLPKSDAILLSNILHDWDEPECQLLVQRCAEALNSGGQLIIHDVFLDDDLQGPVEIAQYSTALFSITEGRAYSRAEYASWCLKANLRVQPLRTTAIHCGALVALKC